MKYIPSSVVLAALALNTAPQASAQYMPPPPPKPFPGFINEWLRRDDPYLAAWDLGGAARVRYEIKDNFGGAVAGQDFRRSGVDNDNSFLMTRVRSRVGYSSEWFSALVEGRHSSTTGDDRGPGAGPESDGPVDLHQAYLSLGNHKEFPLSLKVGRQELSYGEERLIGAFAWNNVGRVFDAAKVRWQNSWFGADFFTSRVVVPNDNNFNTVNDYDWFTGFYANTKKIPKHTTEFYVLARNVSDQSPAAQPGALIPLPGARDIYTFGARFKSGANEFGNWDYTLDLMGQLGHFNDPRAGVNIRSQEHQAYAVVLQGGYTFPDAFGTPRIGLEYAHASGDSDPTDDKHETFENLFPTNHKFYGYMDAVSLQNLHNLRAIYQLRPHARLSLALEGHAFWLASRSDNFYNVAGVPRGGGGVNAGGYGVNPGHGGYLGSELDLIVGCAVSKFAQLEVGFGRFFVGDYIKDSLRNVGGAADANYVYLQMNVTF